MSKNDQKILEMKKQIELKKKTLGKSKSFKAITNLSLNHNGRQINFNTLNFQDAIKLVVELNAILMSATQLGYEDDYEISGYQLYDWIVDLKGKIEVLNSREEEKKLKVMESKLDNMLSKEKQTELELKEMEDLLK